MPVTSAVNAVPITASETALPSTGRSPKPVCSPPSNRITTSATVPTRRASE